MRKFLATNGNQIKTDRASFAFIFLVNSSKLFVANTDLAQANVVAIKITTHITVMTRIETPDSCQTLTRKKRFSSSYSLYIFIECCQFRSLQVVFSKHPTAHKTWRKSPLIVTNSGIATGG